MNSLASNNSQSWLSWFLRGLLIVSFLILFSKLFEVQIIKGSYYRTLAEENRIRHIPIPAPRGKIIARGGEILAGNVEVKRRIKFSKNRGFEITDDLTDASSEEMVMDYKRTYPLGGKFGHASGYLGIVNADQVDKINPDCPEKGPIHSGTLVGRTGLEEEDQCQLMGMDGEELIEVDTQGKKVRSLGRRDPLPGKDLKATIDYGLQTETAAEMNGKKGTAIVSDPSGQILAFYSSPSFDTNLMVSKSEANSKIVSALLVDKDLPFFDRLISGTYHPGSVFKPLVAAAALSEGAIDKNFTLDDPGVIKVNEFSYSNWYFSQYGRREGVIDLTRAIARSTDTFFYKIGEMVGPDKIASWAQKFGLSRVTGIDLPGEVAGLIPTPEWKNRVKKETWFLGNTYHMSIGQGDVAVTPLAINTYISAIASTGNLCRPHFNQDINGDCKNMGVDKKNLDLIKEGMRQACSQGGTAFTFFDFPATHAGTEVACKTGTAEVDLDGTPHAWFTFFTPKDNPQIVATVLIEKGGEGSSVAGPIARKIADYYFLTEQTK